MSERASRYTEQLAKLAVEVGANVDAGQEVVVLAVDVEHAPLARAVAEAAYAVGARYVSLVYFDAFAKRSRLLHAAEDSLGEVPDWYARLFAGAVERRSAIVVVWGDPTPGLLDGVDPARASLDLMPLTPGFFQAAGGGEVNWTFIPSPSPGVARRLLGTPDVDALWELMAPIVRLDADDPAAAWREHMARLSGRVEQLTAGGFEALHFAGPGTDLTVGLVPRAAWMTAGLTTAWGRSMVVNMPTEEVFTTPDARRTEGVVRITRPVQLLGGGLVEGLRLRFAGGRVVEVAADAGAEAMRATIAADAGANRLGEIALVDGTSPIGRTGRVFGDVLIDENATCHMALGAAYAFTVGDLPEDEAAQEAIGFNRSAIHQDVMIGGPEVAVEGVRADGAREPILRDDVWQLG